MDKKIVYILRSVPGSGKTTFANTIKELCKNSKSICQICSADEYFEDSQGRYNYIANDIGKAHQFCKNMFETSLQNNINIIIVANTNTRTADVKYYRNLAISYNYQVFVLTVEKWHKGQDIHQVPEEIKLKMKQQLLNSLKL